MDFCIAGTPITWSSLQMKQDGGTVYITADGTADGLKLQARTALFYEGFLDCSIFVTAEKDFCTENIMLSATLQKDCAEYMNGLGAVGSAAHDISFHWDETRHLDCLYVGAVNAGLRLKWKAENYRKPLVNIYYHNLPLVIPDETWANHQNGTVAFCKGESEAKITAQTGSFSMKAQETRRFDFEIHFTPLKAIDYQKHYATRYDHSNHLKDEYKELRRAEKNKLTHMVIHHGNAVHPFINYPFIETERLKRLVDAAKQKNIGVKVYYTTREHSNHMAEVFAYKALDDEIILRKRGEGYPWQGGTAKWLTEYFGEEIIPAWKVEYRSGKYKNDPDVSFIVRPNSRLDNYYIEGLDWLVQNIGIKGIYIDDTALDRTTATRARKVLDRVNGLIDMHMWNHEEARAGNVSCMNLYTELFPFLDSLWIGEGYPYKRLSPDYLLTEVSGLPYGQTSQMLEGGGNPYIGMLYAMNNRYGWGATDAPRIYQIWDDFRIQDSEMRGYWHSQNPVQSGNDNVKATVYLKKEEALVCLFNFADKKQTFRLQIQKDLLDFAPKTAERVYIKHLQRKKMLHTEREMTLRPKNGLIFLLRA